VPLASSWLRYPSARLAALFTWLALTLAALFGTLPLAGELAHSTANLPRGGEELFERGGTLLLAVVDEQSDDLLAALRSSGWLCLASLLFLCHSRALLFRVLDEPTLGVAFAARRAFACLPRFAAAWAAARSLQLACLALPFLVSTPLLSAVEHAVSEPTADIALALGMAGGAVLAVALQFAWTVMGIEIARERGLVQSVRRAATLLRRGRGAPIGIWLLLQALAVLLPPLAWFGVGWTGAPAFALAMLQQLVVAVSTLLAASASYVVIRWTRENAVEFAGGPAPFSG
jgi:hypothetical protein